MRIYFTALILFVLLTIAFIFGSQNNQLINLNYLIARTEISVAAAVSLFTALGFLLGIFTAIFYRLTKKFKSKS